MGPWAKLWTCGVGQATLPMLEFELHDFRASQDIKARRLPSLSHHHT